MEQGLGGIGREQSLKPLLEQISMTFPKLKLIFQDSKIHIDSFTPKISMLILLTVYCTFLIGPSIGNYNFFITWELPESVAFFLALEMPQ